MFMNVSIILNYKNISAKMNLFISLKNFNALS